MEGAGSLKRIAITTGAGSCAVLVVSYLLSALGLLAAIRAGAVVGALTFIAPVLALVGIVTGHWHRRVSGDSSSPWLTTSLVMSYISLAIFVLVGVLLVLELRLR